MNIGLTKEQLARRRSSIGGSDANIILSGDPAAVLRLWQEKTGAAEPEDLSRVLPVQMGIWTEPLNRHWYTLMTGHQVSCAGETRFSADHPFMACTLDGIVVTEGAVFEAKHVNAFSTPEDVAQRYMPQLHHNMAVCALNRAVLSIFIGTLKYETFVVEADPFYTASLIEAEQQFWASVKSNTLPGEIKVEARPVLPTKFRTVDMTGNNRWAVEAGSWLNTKQAASKFRDAEKSIKELIEPDVGEASGAGIIVRRSKAGALTIRELKNAQ